MEKQIEILEKIWGLGQQIWLDNLSRSLIQSGQLSDYIQKGIRGITTNPVIFQQALLHDKAYSEDIKTLKADKSLSAQQRFDRLVIHDVQLACDVFLPMYHKSEARCGFVSIELSPSIAHDVAQTVQMAQQLWHEIQRPNIMIKIPATNAGIQALTPLIAHGININMTLIFSLQQVSNIQQAYLAGVQQGIKSGQDLSRVFAVASVFLSRIDSAIDPLLDKMRQGKTAISIAKMSYNQWVDFFYNQDFPMEKAQPMQLLWASTSCKNPNFPDLFYVIPNIGVDTVNTLPPKTLDILLNYNYKQDNLTHKLRQHINIAHEHLAYCQEHGINLEALAQTLQQQGLEQFTKAYYNVLSVLE